MLAPRRSPEAFVRDYKAIRMPDVPTAPDFVKVSQRKVAGADVYVEWAGTVDALGKAMETAAQGSAFKLHMISSRGTKLYPGGSAITDTVDAFTGRFMKGDGGDATNAEVLDLLASVGAQAKWAHVEKLNVFDGALGYTKAQGED
jgi:isocitrate dehydrogenase